MIPEEYNEEIDAMQRMVDEEDFNIRTEEL